MKTIIKMLVFGLLVISTSRMSARINRTYMNTRSHGVNIAMENSGGWKQQIGRYDENRFGGNLQIIGFYQKSTQQKDLANYFFGTNRVTFGLARNADDDLAEPDVDARLLIHHNQDTNGVRFFGLDPAEQTQVASLSIDPEQSSYGAYISYYQSLDPLLDGLYFSVNLPIVHVENDLNAIFEGTLAEQFRKFFAGEQTGNTALNNTQNPLTKGLIKSGSDTATGVADIDLIIGYNFWQKRRYDATVNIGFTFPTGNEPDGTRMFEAVYGNGQHFGFGAGLDFKTLLWESDDDKQGVQGHIAFNYRYLFKSSERRTMSGDKDDPTSAIFFQNAYGHVAKAAVGAASGSVTPVPNFTTLQVDVTPGSLFDGIVNLTWHYEGFIINAGYNLYYRQAESVKLKQRMADNLFLIDSDQGTNRIRMDNDAVLDDNEIDPVSVETPSQTTHKIYADLAYIVKKWETPINISFGGHYEFANKNALETWGISGRLGVSF